MKKLISSFYQGILPEILEELLAARKRAKADLKVIGFKYFLFKTLRPIFIRWFASFHISLKLNHVFMSAQTSVTFFPHFFLQEAKDPLERAVLDGRQLALKVNTYFLFPLETCLISHVCDSTAHWKSRP